MKPAQIAAIAVSLPVLLACVTPEKAAEQAEAQLSAKCTATGRTYQAVSKSGVQTSPAFIIPTPFFIIGSTGSATGYASGYCVGANPQWETACLERGQLPVPMSASNECGASDEKTRETVTAMMTSAHALCDPAKLDVGSMTTADNRIQTRCVPGTAGGPDSADAAIHNKRGAIYVDQGDYKLALASFDNAARLAPSDAQHVAARARVHWATGAFESAIGDATTAIGMDPALYEAYQNRAAAYNSLGRYDEMYADLSTAIMLAPRRAYAYAERSAALINLGRLDDAIADATKAIELEPRNVQAHHMRGVAYSRLNRVDEAIDEYSEAIRLFPNLALAYRNRGVAYESMRRWDDALADFDSTIRINDTVLKLKPDALALTERSFVHAEKGNLDQAFADANAAIKEDPKSLRARGVRAQVHFKRRAYDLALTEYNSILEIDPKLSSAFIGRGIAYFNLGLFEKAIADFDVRLELEGRDAYGLCYRSFAEVKLMKMAEATKDIIAAEGINPGLCKSLLAGGIGPVL